MHTRRVSSCFSTLASSAAIGSRYRSGRLADWLKFKNSEVPAVKREAEEDWVR
jgi:hypothetical protein